MLADRGHESGVKVFTWLFSTQEHPAPPAAETDVEITLHGNVETTAKLPRDQNASNELRKLHNHTARRPVESHRRDAALSQHQRNTHINSDDSSIIDHTTRYGRAQNKPVFEKRPRHKIRSDKYEVKSRGRKRKVTEDGREWSEKSKKQTRKPTKATAAVPLHSSHNFNCDAVLAERISLPRSLRPGVFANSRNAAKAEVHDLLFPNTADFKAYKDSERPSRSRRSTDRQREVVSYFFETAKSNNQAQRLPSSDRPSVEGGLMEDSVPMHIDQQLTHFYGVNPLQSRSTQSCSRLGSPSTHRHSVVGTSSMIRPSTHRRSDSPHSSREISGTATKTAYHARNSEASEVLYMRYGDLLAATGIFANTGIEILKPIPAAATSHGSTDLDSFEERLNILREEEQFRKPEEMETGGSKHLIAVGDGTSSGNQAFSEPQLLDTSALRISNEAKPHEFGRNNNRMPQAQENDEARTDEALRCLEPVEAPTDAVLLDRKIFDEKKSSEHDTSTKEGQKVSRTSIHNSQDEVDDQPFIREPCTLPQGPIPEVMHGVRSVFHLEETSNTTLSCKASPPLNVRGSPLEQGGYRANAQAPFFAGFSWLLEPTTLSWMNPANTNFQANETTLQTGSEPTRAFYPQQDVPLFDDSIHWHNFIPTNNYHEENGLPHAYANEQTLLDIDDDKLDDHIHELESEPQQSPSPNLVELSREAPELASVIDRQSRAASDVQAYHDDRWELHDVTGECQDMFEFWRSNRFAGF